MTQASSPAEALLGFLGVFDTEDREGLTGAAMVTNERGYPLEFRVASSIRASAVQKALYGSSLEPYVITELIAKRLLSELQRRPALILVNRVNATQSSSSYPLLFAAHADDYVRASDGALAYRRLEPVGGGHPIALVAPNDAVLERCADTVGLAARHFDPVEVFERMKTAVGVLAQSDERYR